MPTFRFERLVRAKLPALYKELGQRARLRELSTDEHGVELARKFEEEAAEVIAVTGDPQELASEVADAEQALDDLKTHFGIHEDVARIKAEKLDKKGGFLDGAYVIDLTLRDGDPWVEYYRKDPGRHTEIEE